MNVDAMLAQLSSAQLAEWKAFFRLDAERAAQHQLADEAVAGLGRHRRRRGSPA